MIKIDIGLLLLILLMCFILGIACHDEPKANSNYNVIERIK